MPDGWGIKLVTNFVWLNITITNCSVINFDGSAQKSKGFPLNSGTIYQCCFGVSYYIECWTYLPSLLHQSNGTRFSNVFL